MDDIWIVYAVDQPHILNAYLNFFSFFIHLGWGWNCSLQNCWTWRLVGRIPRPISRSTKTRIEKVSRYFPSGYWVSNLSVILRHFMVIHIVNFTSTFSCEGRRQIKIQGQQNTNLSVGWQRIGNELQSQTSNVLSSLCDIFIECFFNAKMNVLFTIALSGTLRTFDNSLVIQDLTKNSPLSGSCLTLLLLLSIVVFGLYFECFFIVRYLEGGVDSGFVKVDRDAYRKRLLHVKGKRNIRIEEVWWLNAVNIIFLLFSRNLWSLSNCINNFWLPIQNLLFIFLLMIFSQPNYLQFYHNVSLSNFQIWDIIKLCRGNNSRNFFSLRLNWHTNHWTMVMFLFWTMEKQFTVGTEKIPQRGKELR